MTKNPIFTGAATALVTPLTENGVDYAAFEKLINWQIHQGIDALVICGTTGEASTLTDEEHRQVLKFAAQVVDGRVPIIAGTGSNDTAYAIDMTKFACELVKEISVIENLLVASTRSYKTGFIGHVFALPSLKKEEKLLRAKAMKILKFMGLESYASWYAMGLPYGILKKVEIARALMADAKLIIMDEPAAGLNDSETAELTETIRKIRDKFGVTILLVEHDMGLVMNVCDTVCAISFGQMLAIGTTEEIQQNKAVQEAYLGVKEDD